MPRVGAVRSTVTKAGNNAFSEHPKCFISYSWDSDKHKDWVRNLAAELQQQGVVTFLDQWQVHPGMDIAKYMETSIRDSDFVLLICTPTFAQKANAGKGGVGYERIIVTGEIFQGIASEKKFVPILRQGDPRKSLPSYLLSKAYIDFRNDETFEKDLEQLLRHIYSQPLYIPPPIGQKPSLQSIESIPLSISRKAHNKTSSQKGADTTLIGASNLRHLKKKSLIKRGKTYNDNVFINCPYDFEYRSLFDVLVFTVADCGFMPRTVYEFTDAVNTRIQKIFTLISECKYGIHDISRTEIDRTTELPRFNMPLELGMFLGAQRFDPSLKRQRNCLILDAEIYRYQRFISDIAGLDIQGHNNDPNAVLSIVRDWLRAVSGRSNLPGRKAIWSHYERFKKELPSIAASLRMDMKELTFVDYFTIVTSWLSINP